MKDDGCDRKVHQNLELLPRKNGGCSSRKLFTPLSEF